MSIRVQSDDVDQALIQTAREDAPRVLALVARRFGDVSLADDAVQEALIEAAASWGTSGVPTNPAAWLHQVARRKAIDQTRRQDSAVRRTKAAAPELLVDSNESANPVVGRLIDDDPANDPGLADDQLRLIFLCCHPALNADAQVALTLRLVGGLTTEEIAAAFLVPTPTLAQRISRAKTKVRDAGIPLAMPTDPSERVDAVLSVLYLVFNEGYLGRVARETPMRVDLCEEALRLTESLSELIPGNAEVRGLLALELFHHARRGARFTAESDLILLADQDRSAWDRPTIVKGNGELKAAMSLRAPGRYQLQALIAAHHVAAASASETDWNVIAKLYEQLRAYDPGPVVALNHAVAVGLATTPSAGLSLIAEIEGLDDYHLFHSASAELHLLEGASSKAQACFRRARGLTQNAAEVRHLDQRLAELNN